MFESMSTDTQLFHAHIYFNEHEVLSAHKLRSGILETLFDSIEMVGPLELGLRGPHTLPMFEIHFYRKHLADIAHYINTHRSHHSVLIHPVSGNDIQDHSPKNVRWLGRRVKLSMENLK